MQFALHNFMESVTAFDVSKRYRNWCFTLNNYTPLEEDALEEVVDATNSKVRYIVFGKETASTGTEHLQGYFELSESLTMSRVRKHFSTVTGVRG